MPKYKKWIIAAVAVFLCISGCLYSMWYQKEDVTFMSYHEENSFSLNNEENLSDDGENTAAGEMEVSFDAEEEKRGEAEITIYICGEVKSPGVYSLPSGSRISDALELGGGFTKQAANTVINLAEKLVDGQKIYVPSQTESDEKEIPEMSGRSSAGEKEESSDGLVNINTAGKEELMKLPGIGEAKAESILAYREEQGSFSAVEDLMKIRGIKSGVFDKIKDQIRV